METHVNLKPIIWLPLLLLLGTAHAMDNLRGPVFDEAQDALRRANSADASALSPDIYAKAAENYRRAEALFADGGNLERITRLLADAKAQFEEAASNSARVRTALQPAYQARLDARSAGAEEFASKAWTAASESFYEAARRVEAERKRGVERNAEKAEAGYREAELAAIEVSLFQRIDRQIQIARELDADDEAPISYKNAVDLLNEAKAELARDRYDTDRPRDLARRALHNAMHATYVASLWEEVDDGKTSFEQVLLDWEAEILSTADMLDLSVHFDEGPTAANEAIRGAVKTLKEDLASLRGQYADAQSHIALLDGEVARLQEELGGQSQARERLNQELARRERQKEQLTRLEGLFQPHEALVLRSKERLILRMVGLNFAVGKWQLEQQHDLLLSKVLQALSMFPEVPVIVEGHTDSFGADASNLALSNQRAQEVLGYLLKNGSISPGNLTAVGYGETAPIANNETDDGRRRNRRIDLVIYPNW